MLSNALPPLLPPSEHHAGASDSLPVKEGGGSFSLGARLVPSVVVDASDVQHQVLAITGVDPESACGMAGLMPGDLLLELGGKKVISFESLSDALASAKGCTCVLAKVKRRGGGEEILTLAPSAHAQGRRKGRALSTGGQGGVVGADAEKDLKTRFWEGVVGTLAGTGAGIGDGRGEGTSESLDDKMTQMWKDLKLALP